MLVLDEGHGGCPGVANVGACPFEADRFIEPNAVIAQPPKAYNEGQA